MQRSVTLSSCTARSQGADWFQSQSASLLAGWDRADVKIHECSAQEQPCSSQDMQMFYCSTAFPVRGRQAQAREQRAEQLSSAEQQLQFLSEKH